MDGRALLRNFQARQARGVLPGGEPALLPQSRREKLLDHNAYGYKAVDTVLRGDAAREALEEKTKTKELVSRLEELTATANEVAEDLAAEKQKAEEVTTKVPEQQNLMMEAMVENNALSSKLQEAAKRREELVKEEKRLRASLKDRTGVTEAKTPWGKHCMEFESTLQPFLSRGGDLELMEVTGALFQAYAALSQRAAEAEDIHAAKVADVQAAEAAKPNHTNGHAERLALTRHWALQLASENAELKKRVADLPMSIDDLWPAVEVSQPTAHVQQNESFDATMAMRQPLQPTVQPTVDLLQQSTNLGAITAQQHLAYMPNPNQPLTFIPNPNQPQTYMPNQSYPQAQPQTYIPNP